MKPLKKFSVGAVQAAVWKNAGKEGNSYYTVSLQRSYKDPTKDEWKNAASMRTHDLPKAVLALQKAYEYLALREDASIQP